MPRRSFGLALGVLLMSLVIAVGCKKKPTDAGGGSDPAQTPAAVPAGVDSEHLVFAVVDAKAVRENGLFVQLKQGVVKTGGMDLWNKFETDAADNLGFKPSDVDSVTACITDVPAAGKPKFIVIVVAAKPLNKTSAFGYKLPAAPDSRGLYPATQLHTIAPVGAKGPFVETTSYVHFPTDKTAVLLHADLAQKYLDGYAKSRSGWPLTADLTKAAAGHAAFMAVNTSKLPADLRTEPGLKAYGPLMSARTIALAVDVVGTELSVGVRGTFADAAAAGSAQENAQGLLGQAADELGKVAGGKLPPQVAPFVAAIRAAERAVKAVKVEVSGSDLIATGTYRAEFDLTQMTADAVKEIRESAPRVAAQNNLKLIGLAIHTFASACNDMVIVHGIGPKFLIYDENTKPILSWRVAMLPYLELKPGELGELYKQFKLDEPWDSAHNKTLIEKMPKVFAPVAKPGKPGYTHLQMVIGPKAMQAGTPNFKSSFSDGLSNTIAVVEAAEPVIWTKPDDVMLPEKELPKDFRKKFGGQFSGGFNALLWNGLVKFIPDAMSDRTLGHALTPAGGEVLGSDW